MMGETGFDVELAEWNAGLQYIFAQRAQHHYLAPMELREQHQAIEAVVFDAAAAELNESVLKKLLHLHDVDQAGGAGDHVEVENPICAAQARRDPVSACGQYPEAHAFELRQRIRQR